MDDCFLEQPLIYCWKNLFVQRTKLFLLYSSSLRYQDLVFDRWYKNTNPYVLQLSHHSHQQFLHNLQVGSFLRILEMVFRERPFPEFLKNYLPEDYGEIVDENDEIIGEHKGLYFYTIGQRQGLGIGGLKNRAEKAWYVAQKDFSNNKLVVVQENNHPLLFKQELSVSNINWLKKPSTNKVSAKIRYRQKDQDCEINVQGTKAKVFFKEPQRAVTPGQFIVFYEDEICLGGGEIDI